VRAIWAGKPFVWQIYPQSDGAHHGKLEAFMKKLDMPEELRNASPVTGTACRRSTRQWNPQDWPSLCLSNGQLFAYKLRRELQSQPDLVTQLSILFRKNDKIRGFAEFAARLSGKSCPAASCG